MIVIERDRYRGREGEEEVEREGDVRDMFTYREISKKWMRDHDEVEYLGGKKR